MPYKKIILALLCCVGILFAYAQSNPKKDVIDSASLKLYYAGDWTSLLKYGNNAIRSGNDFTLLRMRTGYAALQLGNYSESLKHYQFVLRKHPSNNIALYYTYLNQVYLNNTSLARYYAGKLSQEERKTEKIKTYRISNINALYSFKYLNLVNRGNGTYGSLGLNLQLGYKFELQQQVAFFNQTISEQKFASVTDNLNIAINQKEYYAKILYAATGNIVVLGGYHYLLTPFNNYTYNNHFAFAGIKYTRPYLNLQVMGHYGTLTDTAYKQLDIVLTTYPFGNSKLYTISKAMYGNEFTFTQIAGYKIRKQIWLEANTTLGTYNKLLDNDNLYIFNDIDTKRFKIGASAYVLLAKKLMVTLNYIYEKKQLYGTTATYFNQHSTTTGLSWTF